MATSAGVETHYWQKDTETIFRDGLRHLQGARLRAMLAYIQARSPFYRDKLARHGIAADRVQGVDDLPHLPFTDREELVTDQARQRGAGGLMCTSPELPGQTIGQTGARLSATGRPVRVLLSPTDAATQGHLASRALTAAGVRLTDYLYIADHPQFNLLYLHAGLGSINLGSKSVLVGMERARRNVSIYMPLYPPGAIFTTPSYARFMAPLLRQAGARYPIRTVICTGEPGAALPRVRQRLESLWQSVSTAEDLRIYDAYGLVELGLLGCACRAGNGMHGFEDAYIYEVVDPESGLPVPQGEEGELVITHLERDGMPLLRYRTGDVTRWDDSPCPCGRTHIRLLGVRGRLDQRLTVAGHTLYPGDIEEAMAAGNMYTGEYNILTAGSLRLDRLEIGVAEEEITPDLCARLARDLAARLDVPVAVQSLGPQDLMFYAHEAQRVIDTTNLDAFKREAWAQLKVEM